MITENNTAIGNATLLAASELKSVIQGKIYIEGSPSYDSLRKIWNGMIDRKPAVIAQCLNNADIQNAIKIAGKYNLLISVRSGGHNVSGSAVCNGGIMIDLSLMKSVRVNTEDKVAFVEGGATWGDFDKAAQEFGLATTGGLISTTGVAGLTLGGGVGWLVRKYGMSCDNLIEAQMITADGELVTASLQENADLLWGLRGGGGNFGIVSLMKFRLHEVTTITGGMILHKREDAPKVLRFYREFMKTAPVELTLYAGLLTSPDGLPVVALLGGYFGDPVTAEKVLKPLREFGSPVADLFQPIPYLQLQTLIDGGFPHGNRYYWKSGFLKDCSDELIDLTIAHMAENPSPYSGLVFEYYGGEATREPEGGSAYPHRQDEFNLVIIANWPDPQQDGSNTQWIRALWTELQPYLSNKVYVNTLGVEGQERIREAYGQNYEELAKLKRRYDPDNVFRMNQNILPA